MLAMQGATSGRVNLAMLEPTDGEPLRRLFFRLSPDTVYRRFMSPIARPEQARPDRLLDIDHSDREAVVAVADGEILGVARYNRWAGSDAAELAVVVADAWQGQGLGTRMLAALADLAFGSGIRRFTVTMLADNRPALRLLRRFSPSVKTVFSDGVLEASVPVTDRGEPLLAPARRAIGCD